jgi:hypothetical protein
MKKIIVLAVIVGAGIFVVGAVSPLLAHEVNQDRHEGRMAQQEARSKHAARQEQWDAKRARGHRVCGYRAPERDADHHRMRQDRRGGCQHWYASFIPWHNCSEQGHRGAHMGC